MEEVETKMCANCKRDISSSNFVMHEMHCRRHIVLCEHCNEPVPRSEIDQHFNDLHATLPCERCQQNIAKDRMERHMTSECEKRPMLCEFCELTVPKIEFESHVDFCGSRTESCPLCQQYVMLKDMLRHENSGCTYPPPKPAPTSQPSSQGTDGDPFSMLEMHHLLGGDNLGASNFFHDFSSNVRRGGERNGQHRPPFGQSERARKNVPSRIDAKKESAGKKRDVNVHKANNLSNQMSGGHKDFEIPPDMDYDTMLALQLAHDDWIQNDEVQPDAAAMVDSNLDPLPFEDFLWDIDPTEVGQRTGESRSPQEDPEATIPCEFCEEEVSLETYMEHVEQCPMSNVRQNNSTQRDLNNEVLSPSLSAARPSIPVINNLGTPASMQRYQDLSPDCEDFMLPCEFCEEIFPSEIIIQHQSVCQSNGMATPRVTTPASGLRSVSHKPPTVSASFNPNIPPSRSNGGQQSQPSLLDFVSDLEEGLVEEYFASEPNLQRVPESSSNKYSAPVDRFDDAVARPPRHSSKSNGQQASGVSAASSTRQARRENSSAQRARARLNQLLQEDADGGVGTSGGNASSGARAVNAERKSNVDSRSVMRQLEASRGKSNINSRQSGNVGSRLSRRVQVDSNISSNNNNNNSSSSSSSNNNGASASNSVPATGARSRQRADHVFSPELRLKPDHNPRSRKK